MKSARVCLASLLLAGAALATSATAGALNTTELQVRIDSDRFDLPAPAAQERGAPIRLWATWYYRFTTDENPAGLPLRDPQGQAVSVPISPRPWCESALQGSVSIRSGHGLRRTYSFVRLGTASLLSCSDYFRLDAPWMNVAGRSRFAPARGPYGDGAAGYVVVPYRSLAVDPEVIPLGSVVYIPAARGQWVHLPDGEWVRHDGWFFASDTGGAIRGHHVDIFTGISPWNPFPNFVSSRPEAGFTAYLPRTNKLSTQLQWQQGLE